MSAGASVRSGTSGAAPVTRVEVSAYRIPTESPESDGTLRWDATTLVLVELAAGETTGLGYTYADTGTAVLIRDVLAPVVTGEDAMNVGAARRAMLGALRNSGGSGPSAMAIAAVDVALWDLKARLLDVPLVTLLGAVRDRVPVYGSGGFTSYRVDELQAQLGGWAEEGIRSVKMKVGRDPESDVPRVAAAREAVGPRTELMVDANAAYDRKQALAMAHRFHEYGVTWFEEPVSARDRPGLRLLRDRAPGGLEITAGEYGYEAAHFRGLLEAGAVDVLQADATRCAGISGFLIAATLCEAHELPFSAHCAPSLHLQPGLAAGTLRHLEYFFDHVRIERMLFDGAPVPADGEVAPDRSRPGLGLAFKRADAAPFAV